MKQLRFVGVMVLLVGLLFSTANVFADTTVGGRPPHNPGAKATEKAVEHGNGNGQDNGNGQGPHNTPGAKATEKASEHETEGVGKAKGRRVTYRGTVTAV